MKMRKILYLNLVLFLFTSHISSVPTEAWHLEMVGTHCRLWPQLRWRAYVILPSSLSMNTGVKNQSRSNRNCTAGLTGTMTTSFLLCLIMVLQVFLYFLYLFWKKNMKRTSIWLVLSYFVKQVLSALVMQREFMKTVCKVVLEVKWVSRV